MTGRLLIAALLISRAAHALGAQPVISQQPADRTASPSDLPAPAGTNGWEPAPLIGAESLCCAESGPRWFFGGDYRLIRTHFSEAVAFATLTQTVTGQGLDLRVRATELDFEYESSFSVFGGYHLNDYADVRFSYWFLDTSTGASGAAAADEIIVDPFGNPAPPGTEIATQASVQLNVLDAEYVRRAQDCCSQASWAYSVGLRFADVDQFYESTITAGGALASNGIFAVDFFGVGPYATLSGHAWATECWSAFAKVGAALLVGQYEIGTDIVVPGQFTAGQSAERIRTIPVLESELGVSFQPSDRLRLSTGWMVQAWMNIGVSGGTFDGEALFDPLGLTPFEIDTIFGGADDADIMSFDGLFFRGEYNF